MKNLNKKKESEYAKAGVDYTKIEPFKQAMIAVGKRTVRFPRKRGVVINTDVMHAHGAIYEYVGGLPHLWCKTQEGLGNKNWIAEWMYQFSGTGQTYYSGIAVDAGLMAVNDLIAQGALPVIYTDEVASGDSEWFMDEKRSHDLAEGFYLLCKLTGMALPAGESPALRYLVRAEAPVKSAPSLSGCVTGIIAPKNRIVTGQKLQEGDHILAAPSSGIHANGISLVIKKALGLKDKFLTELSNGKTLGHEALIPTQSYVNLVETFLNENIDVHAYLPGTGGGLAKIAFDKRQFFYHIKDWFGEIPPLFEFMVEECGVPLEDCLTTFNMGGGYYAFIPPEEVDRAIDVAHESFYNLVDVGIVEKGERKVVIDPFLFRKDELVLAPPGE